MRIYHITDSGVSYRSDGCTLYGHSRHLYFPILLQVDMALKYGRSVNGLSGCMLGRCKFPTITCDKCSFNV